jgi:hypothetical protein
MNRLFTVGKPVGDPGGATRTPACVERLSPDPKWPDPLLWQFQQRLGIFEVNIDLWLDPCGW